MLYMIVTLEVSIGRFLMKSRPSIKSIKTKHPHEIKTKSGLTALYNQPVLKREHVQRDMLSSGGKSIPFVPHQGVK